jgi:stage V sporulation protein R
LLLRHPYEEIELDLDYAQATLANIQRIWNRPVHVATLRDDNPILLSFDGKHHSEEDFE